MKKRWIRLLSILMAATVVMSSAVEVAATVENPVESTATEQAEVPAANGADAKSSTVEATTPATDSSTGSSDGSAGASGSASGSNDGNATGSTGTNGTTSNTATGSIGTSGATPGNTGTSGGTSGSTTGNTGTGGGTSESTTGSTGTSGATSGSAAGSTETSGTTSGSAAGSMGTSGGTSDTATGSIGTNGNASENSAGTTGASGSTTDTSTQTNTETGAASEDISGTVSVENEDISGIVTVETDKNDDNVEIKKNDKPYLALGADLTPEQQASVLAMMGIDAGRLAEYDVVYVNNSEEHQYLGSYIDSSKIGTKSLSSIVIVERKDGNGINISTNNISYCTVGMYKNALATAGIENADIIVAGPSPISGTAALVGVFKAYKEMTGEEIDEENIDAALNELVVTGELKASGADSDEIEGMIAYVKQAVVEHDLSNETEIREIIAEACEKFDLTMTEEEITEVVKLMQKISELDLDVDSLLNSAQTIYEKISTADSGFWAKIRELLMTIIEKIKELF